MSDFSKSPLDVLLENQQKGYVGIHIEQGAPLLDRDLNLLHDLIVASVRSVVTQYIGNGLADNSQAFAIQAIPANQDFLIKPGPGGIGACLVGGIQVTITADTTYKSQAGVPDLTTPDTTQPDPRIDIVYLDVFLTEVDSAVDSSLNNSLDVGMQTSVRLRPDWIVRVAEGVPVPKAPKGHNFYPLAQLQRPRNNARIEAQMITDLRQRRLNMTEIEQRLSLMERLLLLPAFVSMPSPQFIPRRGVINQLITLFGANFDVGAIQVRFNTILATIVGAPSPTQIVVKVPPGLTPAGTPAAVKITVSNAGGADTSDDTFTVEPDPAFSDPGSQFSPNHGAPGAQVTLKGFNFNVGTPQVQFLNQAVSPPITVTAALIGAPAANQIVVQAPSGLVPAGSTSADVQIKVTTSEGTVISDDIFKAEITIPAPRFTPMPGPQFIPRSGVGGQTVTLSGTNFNFLPVTVKFDTTNASVSGAPSSNQIVTLVPPNMAAAGATRSVKITVTTAGGSVTSDDSFNITGP